MISFVLFLIAGVQLSYLPVVSGSVKGMTYVSGKIETQYLFSMKHAMGIWLIGVAVSLLVLLTCILIRKTVINSFDESESD